VAQARSIGADFQAFGDAYKVKAAERQWDFIGRKGAKRALPMPALRGKWQLKNASAALAALDELGEKLPVSLGEVKKGLTLVRLTGRLQSLPGRPAIVLDVAHNPQAARSLADGLSDMGFFENTYAVFGILADKDANGVIEALKGRIDRWFVAAPQAERASSAQAMIQALNQRGITRVRSFATIEMALAEARREAGPNDRIVVFGSFYTVAEALRFLR
jgi:dihydrofolate synthase/folylpolyglutamate synthase